jgi:uncharacterized protein (DUF952 family)
MAEFIYHIVESSYFETFEDKDEYYPKRFEEEGFIHNCFEEQFEYVLGKHFLGIKSVYILKIDPALILAQIIVEGDQHPLGFPHIYGPINLDAVLSKELRQL